MKHVLATIGLGVAAALLACERTSPTDFMKPSPPVEVSGVYTLTVTASNSCSDQLPADATARSYTATLTQDTITISVYGFRVDAVLSGADFFAVSFFGAHNKFSGRVTGNAVIFAINHDAYYDAYDIVERLDERRYFTFSGTSIMTALPAALSGSLTGPVQVFDAPNGFNGKRTSLGTCTADNHGFMFTPAVAGVGVARRSARALTLSPGPGPISRGAAERKRWPGADSR
jgi:hypothetical protein